MKRAIGLIFLFLAFALALAPVQRVQAVHGGQFDGEGHPYIALATDAENRSCVATLISPLVLLTASSCFEHDGEPVWVTFSGESNPPERPASYSGIWVPHPDYCLNCPSGAGAGNGPELAVILLDKEVTWIHTAQMSTWREFEWLRPGASVLLGGYKQDQGNGLLLQRYIASGTMAPFQAGQIKEYFSVETGRDGKCFTEWGGPVFFNDRIVGIVPYGASMPCATATSAYSLNNPRAMEFVYGAIEDPAGLKSRHDFR